MDPLSRGPAGREDPLEKQVVDNRYRLIRRIGSGGMSVVYLAERLGIGKPIAIKFLRSAFVNLPDFVSRFEGEARACSRLSHLNCVSVIDFGVAFGSPYLIMEYVHGTLLSTVIARGRLAPERAIAMVRQILAGLRHAHTRGVIHRDLKPGNIILVEMTGAADFVKIMDFGTAQILTGEGASRNQLGTDVGTPWYMSPEQAAGQPTDPRTDLYSVGVMLFELLTGVRPFVADDPMRVLEMHLKSPIPSLRVLRPDLGISPELETAIVRALQKQPSDRFASAEEFDAALQGVPEIQRQHPPRLAPAAASELPAAEPELDPALEPVATAEMFEPAPTVFAPRSRSPLWIVLGAILLLAGVAGALYLAGVFRR